MRRQGIAFSAAVLCGLMVLAGGAAAQDWQAGAGDDWRQTLAAAKAEGTVVVAGSPDLSTPISEGFQRDTGIKVRFLGGNPRDLTGRIEREVRSNNLTVDILLGGASDLTLVKEGFAVPIKPQFILPGVTDPKNWADGAIKWVDTAEMYMFQGAEYVNAQPFFNTAVLKPDEIKNWKDHAQAASTRARSSPSTRAPPDRARRPPRISLICSASNSSSSFTSDRRWC